MASDTLAIMRARLEEVDALRGMAILSMIAFHAAVMTLFFDLTDVNIYTGPWHILARFTQYLFLGLVGVSIVLSRRTYLGQVQRAAKIFMGGILVSLASSTVLHEDYVRFGILHFIGVAILLVAPFKGWPFLALLAAGISIALGEWFEGSTLDLILYSPWDYFSPFPWLAVPLIGIAFGEFFYKKRKPTFLHVLSKVRLLPWLGRHSLAIYLLHFPILYSLFQLHEVLFS